MFFGNYINWHRYYDPSTGRYLTPDPIGLEGGINLYSYAIQNPVNYIDPFGLFGEGINAGDNFLGHSDFTGSNRFDFTREDKGFSSPFNPVSTWLHFRDKQGVEDDLAEAIKKGNVRRFESLMHQGQDYFSHYQKGFRWYPQWEHGWGHLDMWKTPDQDLDAWIDAEMWTQKWLNEWDKYNNSEKCP